MCCVGCVHCVHGQHINLQKSYKEKISHEPINNELYKVERLRKLHSFL